MSKNHISAQMPISQSELANVYKLLSEAYIRPPTEELCNGFRRWYNEVNKQQTALWEALENVANGNASKLASEYTRLIQGYHQSCSPHPPHESVYRDGRLQGPASVAVEQLYADAGLSYDGPPEQIDHLGTELLFMSQLCELEKKNAQKQFLENHLTEWISDYYTEAKSYGPPKFYVGVFDLTQETVKIHKENLDAGSVG